MTTDTEALKRIARRHYEAYQRATAGLDCGAAMAQHISATASEHARGFDAAMDALATVDASCPAFRLSTGAKQ